MNTNAQNRESKYKLSVASGDLAAKGKGTVTITHTPDGRFWVRVSLPDETGALKPLDLTTIDRVELVDTKTGWFEKGQWVKPLIVTVSGAIGIPLALAQIELFIFTATYTDALLLGAASLGASYVSGAYTGTKLTRLARFIVITQDDQHVVLEGPESVFRFMNGVYAAPNIQLKTPSKSSEDPAPVAA